MMSERIFLALTVPVRDSDIGMPRVMVEAPYLRAVEVAGALALVISPLQDPAARLELLERAGGLVLTGGEDVDPARYGERPDGARTVSPERDAMELELIERALERRMPVLAICRGMQILNVALGGTLFQDLQSHRSEEIDHDRYREFAGHIHPIRVDGADHLADVFAEPEFVQNSAHHQGIKRLAEPLTAVAWAPDGLVEAVELRRPEGGWVVGVQWHPERKIDEASGTNRRLFERFGRETRAWWERRTGSPARADVAAGAEGG